MSTRLHFDLLGSANWQSIANTEEGKRAPRIGMTLQICAGFSDMRLRRLGAMKNATWMNIGHDSDALCFLSEVQRRQLSWEHQALRLMAMQRLNSRAFLPRSLGGRLA